jgi:DNA invertase Pin-like site-specific DNA recombinase
VIWYRDTLTGKTMDRPGRRRVCAGIESGHVKTVVVWRLDRLGRTAKGLTGLFEDLGRRKVNLISLRDGFDISTSAGRLMAHVWASVAQYETEIRAERTLAEQEAARAQGVRFGRPNGPGKRLKVTAGQETTVHRTAEG